jgi:hypothetical protein
MKNIECNILGSVKTYLQLSLSPLLSELLDCDYKVLFVKFGLLNHITVCVISSSENSAYLRLHC